jgi:hypothetical protein
MVVALVGHGELLEVDRLVAGAPAVVSTAQLRLT